MLLHANAARLLTESAYAHGYGANVILVAASPFTGCTAKMMEEKDTVSFRFWRDGESKKRCQITFGTQHEIHAMIAGRARLPASSMVILENHNCQVSYPTDRQ